MDVTIEKLIYGGDGLAHHEGSTVFVPFVLPAERVAVSPVEQKKKFVRARVDNLLEPSPQRVLPPCPHFGICGGCNYQHIPYEAQLAYKAEILRETLRRIGRIDWTGEIKTHASPPWGYRNRAQWKIRPPSEATSDSAGPTASAANKSLARLEIGYFRANSTALCAVDECAILSPLLLKTLLGLRAALAAGELPRELREIEVFSNEVPAKQQTPAAQNFCSQLTSPDFPRGSRNTPKRFAAWCRKLRASCSTIPAMTGWSFSVRAFWRPKVQV